MLTLEFVRSVLEKRDVDKQCLCVWLKGIGGSPNKDIIARCVQPCPACEKIVPIDTRRMKGIIVATINLVVEWKLVESPKAYTWDPEAVKIYDELGIAHEIKETFYTSVHYVIKPYNSNSQSVCCEIQVRTLFEKIWGEIDYTINYPHATESIACKKQLKVLAKLISSGTRLGDSIFRSYNEFNQLKEKKKLL